MYCDKTQVSSFLYINDGWIEQTRYTNRLIIITAGNKIFFFQVYILIRLSLILWKKKVRICTCQLLLPSLSGNKHSLLVYEWTLLFCQKNSNLDKSFNKQQIVKNHLIWLLVHKTIKNVSVNTLATKGWLRTLSILYWMQRGNTMTKNEEKAEVMNAFFTSDFQSKNSYSSGSQTPELEDRDRKSKAPIIQGEMVSIVLHHLLVLFFLIQNNKC